MQGYNKAGLNIEMMETVYDRVITDGNIYNSYTLPVLKEIALEVEIGIIKPETDMYCFFIPSMEAAIKQLGEQAKKDIEVYKDMTLANVFNHVYTLCKEYKIEIGNNLYLHYIEQIKELIKNKDFK